jgi:hypothetical protein
MNWCVDLPSALVHSNSWTEAKGKLIIVSFTVKQRNNEAAYNKMVLIRERYYVNLYKRRIEKGINLSLLIEAYTSRAQFSQRAPTAAKVSFFTPSQRSV